MPARTWRVMVDFGLGAEKVVKVAGMADREQLYPDTPNSPLNRRISIILQKQQPLTRLPPEERAGTPAENTSG